jgi:hypothetical protein
VSHLPGSLGIDARGVTRDFGKVRALDGVSLQITRGLSGFGLRIRQVADIKKQFQVARVPVFVSKAKHLNTHRCAFLMRTEPGK